MMKNLYVSTLLQLEGSKKVARLAGNRCFDAKNIKMKKKSLMKYGMLTPAVIIDAIDPLLKGFDVVDFEKGTPIEESEKSNYIVLLDANHRYKAYLEIPEEERPDFYVMSLLNNSLGVKELLMEMNVATNPWKLIDYLKEAVLCNPDLRLLEEMMNLTDIGYSLGSACRWLTFENKIKKTMLCRSISGDVDDALRKDDCIDEGLELINVAKSKLGEAILKTRVVSGWVVNKCIKHELKAADIIDFFKDIEPKYADTIRKVKGTGGRSKEAEIVSLLDHHFNTFINTRE